MLSVELLEDVQNIRNEYSRVVNMERRFPHFEDGQIFSNRQIMSALWELTGGTREAVKASRLAAEVENRFHLKSVDTIGKTAINMATEMYPLIEGANEDEMVQLVIPELANQYGAMAHRYVHLRMTDLGLIFMKYVNFSDKEYNYNHKEKIPATIRTLIPYTLMKSNYGLGVGLKADKVPLNARELFYTMAMLTADENISDVELAKVFRGVDLPGEYMILTTDDSLKSLLREGYFKFTVICPFSIKQKRGDIYTLTINKIPYSRTIQFVKNEILEIKFAMELEALIEKGFSFQEAMVRADASKKKFESFTAYSAKPIVKHGIDMEVEFRLHAGYNLKDVEDELLSKTSLKTSYTTEYIGVIHGDGDAIADIYNKVMEEGEETEDYSLKTQLIKPENQRLELMGVREILTQHIQVGILCRRVHYSDQLKALKRKIWRAKLLEKVTRPEVAEELTTFLNQSLEVKYELALDLAKRKIPEGLSDEELKELFKEESNQYLGKLHRYQDARYAIEQQERQIEQIRENLKEENIRKEIITDLLGLAERPEFARRSTVLFEKADYLDKQLEEISPIVPMIDPPYPATLVWNKYNYETTLTYQNSLYNTGATNQIDFVVGQDIILGVTPYSIEPLHYHQLTQLPSVVYSEKMGTPYSSYMVISSPEDLLLLVTDKGRLRLLKAETILNMNYKDRLTLRDKERLFHTYNVTHLGMEFFIDSLIKGGGMRRMSSSEVPLGDTVGGRFKSSVTINEEFIDIAFHKEDTGDLDYVNIKGLQKIETLPYLLGKGLEHNPFKLPDKIPPEFFVQNNKVYFQGVNIPYSFFGETSHSPTSIFLWKDDFGLNPTREDYEGIKGSVVRSMRKRLSQPVREGMSFQDVPLTMDDYMLTTTRLPVTQTMNFINYDITQELNDPTNQLLEVAKRIKI